ncbi:MULTISPECIES: hypothetical protein [Planktothricoides]|uniref:Uncharacterized protein n=2 Tax=Planktothricoides raciborskii TaxID=132608 RepID=A0AAU8JM68_9CYAN|nr:MULTISPECIES: hypothetical protein [Planktothricoides]MBD2543574.1 hypothetical protein [Planktothricoides raciborskii FACHB-1370]MBD2581264.1 hypothetical protein [Planktothricoides raciborskii FACHB-1261]
MAYFSSNLIKLNQKFNFGGDRGDIRGDIRGETNNLAIAAIALPDLG